MYFDKHFVTLRAPQKESIDSKSDMDSTLRRYAYLISYYNSNN